MYSDGRMTVMPSRGAILCLASAAAFGAMGIFGKLAYDEGATVGTLLAVRFAFAAVLSWGVVVATGALPQLRRVTRRDLATAAGLGLVGYSAQAGCYFAALDTLDASLLSLLLYTFPAMVTVAAVLLGRARADRRTTAALLVASAGLVLVLGGASAGALDVRGTVLGIGAAVVYSGYILTAEGVSGRVAPMLLSALVCTGAAITLAAGSALAGDLHPGAVTTAGYGWLGAIAVVSTVGAIVLFFAGLGRVGSTSAAILSTMEPVSTVLLAYLVLSESLGPVQLAGGGLVLAAALWLSSRSGERPVRDALPAIPGVAATSPRAAAS